VVEELGEMTIDGMAEDGDGEGVEPAGVVVGAVVGEGVEFFFDVEYFWFGL